MLLFAAFVLLCDLSHKNAWLNITIVDIAYHVFTEQDANF